MCVRLPGGSLPPSVSAMPAHPVPVAVASTFLGSQNIRGLALAVNAHLPEGKNQGHSLTKHHWPWEATTLLLHTEKLGLTG